MKKYIFYIILLIIVDVLVSVAVSTHMLSMQASYIDLKREEKTLQTKNNSLAQETAHLSSIRRVSHLADQLGLSEINNEIVYIEKDVYAALRY
jgi:cell division protein FtsL